MTNEAISREKLLGFSILIIHFKPKSLFNYHSLFKFSIANVKRAEMETAE